jgi:hypothetical protein
MFVFIRDETDDVVPFFPPSLSGYMDDWNFSPTVLAGCMYGDVMNKDFG